MYIGDATYREVMNMISEKTIFTFSLGRLVAVIITIIGFAFTIGMSYQTLLPDRALQEKQTQEIEDIKITLSRVTTILENMEKVQENNSKNISALEGRGQTMNVQLELISSEIKEMKYQKGYSRR